MASKAVATAVEARLGATWTAADTTALPVIGLNSDTEAPPDGKPHIEVQYPVASETQASIGSPGSNLWREEGAFRIVLNEERGNGLERGRTWTEELRSLFRGQFFDGVETFAPAPAVENNDNDNGNYFQFSFAVPYRTYLTG